MIKTLRCFARGYDGKFEAICIDLDISVTARTIQEAQAYLNEAVEMYIEAAAAEAPETAKRLLSRQSPWHVRLSWIWGFAIHMMFATAQGGKSSLHAGYEIPCPA